MGVAKELLKAARGVASALGAIVPSADSVAGVALRAGKRSNPDLVFQFHDESAIPKIVASFQRNGFFVEEIEPALFAFYCKYEVLLQWIERLGWKRLDKTGELITFVLEARDEFENVDSEDRFLTPAERLILVRRLAEEDEVLRSLRPNQVTVIPPNDPVYQSRLSVNWVFRAVGAQPLNDIRAYLGEELAFYFAFLGVYTTWLVPPAVLGVALYFHQSSMGFATVQTFAYSVFLAIWATLFLEHWKRKEKTLGYEWGCLDVEEREVDDAQLTAIETNDQPQDISIAKLYLGYFTSYLLMGLTLISGIVVMGFLLRLDTYAQVYWQGKDWEGLWAYAVYLPQVMLSVTIMIYRTMNKGLAVFTTRLEQRKSEIERREALVTKLVVFNFINYYAALIHTAFVDRNLAKLRSTLMTLLVVQQVVGQVAEVGLPLLKGAFTYYTSSKAEEAKPSTTETGDESKAALASRVRKEAALDIYAGVFDDYLELWVQMGQVCLFSSIYPLAALVAFLNNIVEIRTDAFKIVHASRRTVPHRKSGIGSWLPMFDFLGYAAVVTNLSLVGLVVFSSQSKVEEIRSYLDLSDIMLLLVLVGAEHALILFKVLLSILIPDVPDDVKLKLQQAAKREEVARMKSLEQRARLRHIFSQFKNPDALRATVRSPNAKDEPISEALIAFVTEQAMARTHAEAGRERAEREMRRIKQALNGESIGFVAVVLNVALSIVGGVLLLAGGHSSSSK